MKTKKTTKTEQIELLLSAVGKSQREIYLDENPTGFAANTKCHESKKVYKRINKHKADNF